MLKIFRRLFYYIFFELKDYLMSDVEFFDVN